LSKLKSIDQFIDQFHTELELEPKLIAIAKKHRKELLTIEKLNNFLFLSEVTNFQ